MSVAGSALKGQRLKRAIGAGPGERDWIQERQNESFAFSFKLFLSWASIASIKRNLTILVEIRSENNSSTAMYITIHNN